MPTPAPPIVVPMPAPPIVVPAPSDPIVSSVPAPSIVAPTPAPSDPIVASAPAPLAVTPALPLPIITPTPLPQQEAATFPDANVAPPVLDQHAPTAMDLKDEGSTPGPDNFSLATQPLGDYNWDMTSEFFSQYSGSGSLYLPNAPHDSSYVPFPASSGLAPTHEPVPRAASIVPSPASIPSPMIIPTSTAIPSPSNISSASTTSSIPPATAVPVVTSSYPPPQSTSNTTPLPLGSANSAVRSRSGRQIIASKHADEMNKIGSDQATILHSTSNKENIPPEASVPIVWHGMAEVHLHSMELREKWAASITTWTLFEDAMSSNSKVGLTAKSQPEEWQKWVSKSQNGVRAYDATPLISDPLEFGYAVMAWWKHMQPEFRQTTDVLPAPVYQPSQPSPGSTDVWTTLRKGGLNGMVTILTLLAWWGQALSRRSQFQEDSRPLWDRTVDDVRECLAAMLATPTVLKCKRAGPSGSSKRAKTAS
ncbi:hypothetical protein DXG01_013050 [Tephrocybe rancida]|nr:hypothetical protein DXG01_013050 [Tephrocybe rancida]